MKEKLEEGFTDALIRSNNNVGRFDETNEMTPNVFQKK